MWSLSQSQAQATMFFGLGVGLVLIAVAHGVNHIATVKTPGKLHEANVEYDNSGRANFRSNATIRGYSAAVQVIDMLVFAACLVALLCRRTCRYNWALWMVKFCTVASVFSFLSVLFLIQNMVIYGVRVDPDETHWRPSFYLQATGLVITFLSGFGFVDSLVYADGCAVTSSKYS